MNIYLVQGSRATQGKGLQSKRKEKTLEMAKRMCTIYDNGAISESIVRKCFTKFKSGIFDPEDWEHCGIPAVVDDDQVTLRLKII